MKQGTSASSGRLPALIGLAVLVLASACATSSTQRSAGVLDYLYPEGKPAQPPTDVHLELPLRVGVAFVPEEQTGYYPTGLEESEKQRLLERVRDAFLQTEETSGIEIVPSTYVIAGGGFENLDQLRAMLGIDVIALISYDQRQIEDLNTASITYWTILGAYVVPGNENETHTFVSASVFDIPSRALLLNATGSSTVEDRSTALGSGRSLREGSSEGMALAIDDMVGQLETALSAFREQVKTGTVRGPGTPAIDVCMELSVQGTAKVGKDDARASQLPTQSANAGSSPYGGLRG